jgi:hypothetical protein
MTRLTRRTLLTRSAASVATLGLASAVFGGDRPTCASSPRDAISQDWRSYGAVGDGRTDDTAAVRRIFADAQRTGNDVVVPPGRFLLTEPQPVSTPVIVRGSGDGSVFVAGRPMPEILRVTIPQRGLFTDLKFDGAGLADHCVTQFVPQETSVGTRWVRCKFTGAREVQMVNQGCEDVTYFDCATDGDEAQSASIPDALMVHAPNGAVRIIGGEWFGRCTFNFQQVTIIGATIGPLFVDNPDGRSDSLLVAQGCYLYDGGVHHDACVSTGTSLSNVHLTGCYLAAGSQDSYLNGHLPSVFVRVQDCVFVQPPTAPDGYVSHILTASGTGQLTIDGGRASLRPGGALHAFRPVGDATVQVATQALCIGMT